MLTSFAVIASPAITFAFPLEIATFDPTLEGMYESRKDLQAAFDPISHRAILGGGAGILIDLEDWARQYGWREYPALSAYAPTSEKIPVRSKRAQALPAVTAASYLIMDWNSKQILAAKAADVERPIASLTKLVTADVVLDSEISMSAIKDVQETDDVGGAKLRVASGDALTVEDLFYATLVASANNAANALARSTGLSKDDFVSRMNERAAALNLSRTRFIEPTGIEPANVSTAREMARLAEHILARPEIRRYTSTARKQIHIASQGTTKEMINTNWLLRLKRYNDVYVTSGKTGYIDESGWNVVTTVRPQNGDASRELLIVVFGSGSRQKSFDDADHLAAWAWKQFTWAKAP
jgi:D-alanyl-D-alanine endopeptidase (penicillin-binding protein 7)